MAILSKGNTYSSGDAVTAANLNGLVDSATFVTGSNQTTDDSTLEVHSSGYLKIKDGGVDTTQLAAGAVTSDRLATSAITTLMPSGSVIPYAGTSTPTNWLLCAGQAVSRTTYADLFSAISTTYGVGDGSTTFNIPDLRGRVIAGQDDMNGSSANRLTGLTGGVDGDVLGGTGGSESHTLSVSEIPAHTHYSGLGGESDSTSGGDTIYRPGGASAVNTGATGGGGAHNNVQPTLVLNYIIKT
jgi:microcystin-dependent protein